MLIEIYRGILDIIHTNHGKLRTDVIHHIRKFDDPEVVEDKELSICYGFWRMMLELLLNVYFQISIWFAVILIFFLCIIAWPFTFILSFYSGLRYQSRFIDHIEPSQPVIDTYHLDQDSDKKEDKNGTPRSKKA